MKNLAKKKQLIAFKHEGFGNAWIHLEKKLFRKTLEKKSCLEKMVNYSNTIIKEDLEYIQKNIKKLF